MNVSQPVGMRSATHVFLLLTVATLQCANPPVDNRLFLRSFLSISIWSRRLAAPGERVFDPSGLAYFLPPCAREWYLDTLFEPGARTGAWMADAAALSPEACPWVLFTYRLEMLPAPAKARLVSGWERRVWGLGLRRGDPRLADLPPARPGDEITTFW